MDQLLVSIYMISIDEVYDLYVPINMKVSELITFLQNKAVEITEGTYQVKADSKLYDITTTKIINPNNIVKFSGIKFGSKLLLK